MASRGDNRTQPPKNVLSKITRLAPLWTAIAAVTGLLRSQTIGPSLGSLPAVSNSLSVLMLAMGLTTSPRDIGTALSTYRPVIALNFLCCFIMMPLLAFAVSAALGCSREIRYGTVLLGCVGGGQASNLFALLAGGDVSLSVVCTLSTTAIGAFVTPILVGGLLGESVAIDGLAVLKSTTSLVLAPLFGGIVFGGLFPKLTQRVPCAAFGILATMVLVAGGAANSASSLLGYSAWRSAAACSILLPLAGGSLALLMACMLGMDEPSKRTLAVEVLSKSPTVAYVLALKHFNTATASVPSAGMISLAILGALVASIWSLPIFNASSSSTTHATQEENH
eukprot:CAMPEP_0178638294 /NCGR_PEP_ID=MMETSP0698-20121128/14802_1 /TAXON_ID=265572 /ORGANISM="Extubocellulus spinifer, Strain CCMP396" /LENGTH=336 /DNA_ID=CAMNT_0020278449 /DNA_START=211 /DNA_END=1221 /DNA_ORIENTATION=+